jgi:hypothetical protein
MFQCVLCKKEFACQRNLNYHIQNKVCERRIIKCPLCEKVFKNKAGLLYHQEHIVCKKSASVTTGESTVYEQYDKLSKEALIRELCNIKGKYDSLKENPVNQSNNVFVFPTAFGQENPKRIRQVLGDILGKVLGGNAAEIIPMLIKQIHNNEELPEYHNVYVPSENSQYALVSDGTRFNHRPKDTIIDQIIEDKRSILNTYIDNNGDQLGERILRKYERYQDQIDSDSKFKKNLEREIGGLLLDMKDVIANDDKTRKLLEKIDKNDFVVDNSYS